MSTDDDKFMQLALACAAKGLGAVEPNPMVGAVLVRDGVEIARGWHRKFGGPHAEVDALAAARQAGADVAGATMYVTLEPCSHHGKTPPCADALIAAGLARVVVAMGDPDDNVSGRGLDKLRAAGVDVTVGVCEAEARELLAPYCKLRTQGRPWVLFKWAQTAEGYLALPPGCDRWISGPESRAHVHEIRSWCQGILVGIGTVLADDPLLTNRSGAGGQPARVVLDSRLRTPADCQLLRTADQSPVIVATTEAGLSAAPGAAEAIRSVGGEVLALPAGEAGVDLAALLDEFGRRKWMNLLVEGGQHVLASFVDGGLADELLAFVAPPAGEAVSPAQAGVLPRFDVVQLAGAGEFAVTEERQFGADVMRRYRRPVV